MNNYDAVELSKIYKRVMLIELILKEKIYKALINSYSNPFNRLIPFLNKISHSKYRYKKGKYYRDKINDIINSNSTQEIKLYNFLKVAYLSDTIKILTEYPTLNKDTRFCKNFYSNKPYMCDLTKNANTIVKLRNSIMHFNLEIYKKNKLQFVECLRFWEILLYCPNAFMHSQPRVKPYTKRILKQLIYNIPNLFDLDDRLVLDMFDDLAFINGCPVKDLPKLWTVGRSIYDLKKDFYIDISQLNLPIL